MNQQIWGSHQCLQVKPGLGREDPAPARQWHSIFVGGCHTLSTDRMLYRCTPKMAVFLLKVFLDEFWDILSLWTDPHFGLAASAAPYSIVAGLR